MERAFRPVKMGASQNGELNGYPGPAHVLELAIELEITAKQHVQTAALLEQMQSSAITVGKAVIEEECALDQLFVSRTVDAAMLARALARISSLQGQLRQVHMEAHLAQTALFSPQQAARYVQLRGYSPHSGHERHGDRHH